MNQPLPCLLFWLSLVALLYTYAGYPLLILLLARLRPLKSSGQIQPRPPLISVVIAVHNEAERVTGKLQNLLASDYPADRLDIVVVSDSSTDSTAGKIQSLNESRVQLIVQPVRSGKASCLNLALAAARGEIIVFTDARQSFEPKTVRALAEHFSDPRVGAVSGELIVDSPASAVGGGVDTYWRLEKILRHAESLWDSCIGCTGAVYAVRRSLFRELPPDTILDDVVIPMRMAVQGYRIAFDPVARAHDPQPLEPAREKIRKRRTLAGNYQMLFRHPDWLLPWRNRLWWQLISHKYLRLAAPWFMLLLFVSNLALIHEPLYRWLFFGQCAFYTLALAGLVFPFLRVFLFSVPAGFVFLNAMAALGLWHYLRLPAQPGWDTAPAANARAASQPYV